MTKRIIYLFLITLVFSSCKKNDNTQNVDNSNYSEINVASPTYNVTMDPLGWLIFQDRNAIVNTILNLQQSDEEYDDVYAGALDAIHDGISLEAEEAIVAGCGYIEGKPVLDFENLFTNYTSIRAKLEQDQDDWLAQQSTPIDFSTMPTHVFDDPYTGSVYNDHGEVQVGGIVYFTKPDGRQVGIERQYLNYEILHQFRLIFEDPSFDPFNYNSEPLKNDSLESAFLFGEQLPLKRISTKGNGNVVRIIIIIGSAPITIIWDFTKWLNNPNGSVGTDCHMYGSLEDGWNSGNYSMDGSVRLIDQLVIGQWAKSKVEHFKNDHRRFAHMTIRADCDVFDVALNGGCVTTIDHYNDLDKSKNRRRLSKIKAVGLYNQMAIHDNIPPDYYLFARLSKDNSVKIELK